MPIKTLNVSDTQFKYLEPFKNLPLKTLRANNSKITNLRTLSSFAKTLTVLELNNVKATQFDAMANLNKLTHLSLADTQFSDPALLSSMKLVSLNLNRTKVDSIDALNPGALKVLCIEDTDVESIATLQGCELDRFYCKGAPLKNYRPIYGAPIRYMSINRPASMKQLFGKLPKLLTVNGRNIHKRPQWN